MDAVFEKVRNPVCEGARLSRASTRENERRPGRRRDGLILLGIQFRCVVNARCRRLGRSDGVFAGH